MVNNSRYFESRQAFWALICILISLVALYAANSYADHYNESSAVLLNEDQPINETYEGIPMSEGYKYEVVAENGTVNVYSIDPNGGKAFFCETQIPYALLSENDKRMMKKGVVLNTMEELNSLLQDFES
ncbi:MAG: BofC C-terminal domain-containing protein [Firmicutes bacterium]|nr:BofC C-terminal domain-containing protein [Bacillota bacterium]